MTNRSPYKSVLSTGQVASICGVAHRTACKWIDEGFLRGYTVPASRDRRVRIEDLVAFMTERQFPAEMIPLANPANLRIVVYDPESMIRHQMMALDGADFTVRVTGTAFDAGIAVCESVPHVVVLDVRNPAEAAAILRSAAPQTHAQRQTNSKSFLCVGFAPDLTSAQRFALTRENYDAAVGLPLPIERLTVWLKEIRVAGSLVTRPRVPLVA